ATQSPEPSARRSKAHQGPGAAFLNQSGISASGKPEMSAATGFAPLTGAEAQRFEFKHFHYRHFWHAGYDKAEIGLAAGDRSVGSRLCRGI
ncbi:MAG TPA: hypothetical protein VJ770_16705, partial [Stellaceae bacterium]|nr:hypothetical protein [Stellaceae bacterium]